MELIKKVLFIISRALSIGQIYWYKLFQEETYDDNVLIISIVFAGLLCKLQCKHHRCGKVLCPRLFFYTDELILQQSNFSHFSL